MIFDEPVTPKRDTIALGAVLDDLSIDDLVARIEALRAEIDRVETVLTKKRSGREAADAFFSKP